MASRIYLFYKIYPQGTAGVVCEVKLRFQLEDVGPRRGSYGFPDLCILQNIPQGTAGVV